MKRLALLFALLALQLPLLAHAAESAGSGGPYLAIEPAIVVNLQGPGRPHFMQVRIQAMSDNPKVLDALKTHSAPVRDALIMLLSAQTVEGMYDVQNREKVRQEALDKLRQVLADDAGIPANSKEGGLEALYFTDFVIQ